jgi:ABC-2 type transport system permease protein
VGSDLISQDLRFNALPLYFSRPLRRVDYFFGKLGVIGALLGMVIVVPSLIAYILGILFSLDITIIRDTFPVLLASLAYGVVVVISAGTLILALSSLSRNSRYIALMWVAVWFVSMIVSAILVGIEQDRHFRGYGHAEQIEASKIDWRPLVSYSGNLSRIGHELLGTEACRERLSKIQFRDRGLFAMLNSPQYPWYWSAGVLAVLFGISVCILHFRVRSLDRLK